MKIDEKKNIIKLLKDFKEQVNSEHKPTKKEIEMLSTFLREHPYPQVDHDGYKKIDMRVLKYYKVKDLKEFTSKEYMRMKKEHLDQLKQERRERK